MKRKKTQTKSITAVSILRKHFDKMPLESLITSSRTFPITSQIDLQISMDEVIREKYPARLFGVHSGHSYETMTFASMMREGNQPVMVGPLQYGETDIGEVMPARCLKRGVWLSESKKPKFALLLTQAERFGQCEGIHVELAVPPGEAGLSFSQGFFGEVEKRINKAGSYRGKVISLEKTHGYSGKGGGVTVHKLRGVNREDVILPEKTLKLLERNVAEFIQQREALRKLGMPVKKGLLFYGPPGTGKTHTIHYLASRLPDHTTLLITAEQVGLLDDYFQLARFLQPAMVIIEDADLIARSREDMNSPCAESLLNRLLNEMDGLKEDAAILFILTTNRPEQLEAALASRPGRVDQAIEFPLPDEDGRRKLVLLYARGLKVSNDLVQVIVSKTNKASAAFIKELMRRCAQYCLQEGKGTELRLSQVEAALDEMLFSGGSLNVKLLGGANQDEF